MIVFPLVFRKRFLFTAFVRQFTIGMITFNSLVTGISLYSYQGADARFAFFKQSEIVLPSFFYLYTQYLPGFFINNDLCF